ncbi:hypothetical protein [Devosia sp.]|uniref:hypothetical protein n=1 Tax=Devosia sp. TaxID=1871048 RepID=UPI002FCB42C6
MTSPLRAPSLATLAATFLFFASPNGAFADGRADWPGYAWQQIRIAECLASGLTLQCPAYHQKWDWKRNQWVDIAITLDLSRGQLHLTQQLTDNDPHDDDYVCVTALAVDADGKDLVAHHQNWHIGPGQVIERSFIYRSDLRQKVAVIHIGSKQCRQGAGQDDALYAQVLARIHP